MFRGVADYGRAGKASHPLNDLARRLLSTPSATRQGKANDMTSQLSTHIGWRRRAGRRRYAIGAAAVAFGAVALAGCSSGNGSSGSGSNGSTGAPLYGGNAATTATSGPATSGTQTLTVKRSSGGTSYLTDKAGKTLYLFQADSNGKSNCNGSCAAAWPPLTGSVTAGTGVTGKMTTFSRSDGAKQAVLNGHPLYYYTADTAPGNTNGQGLNVFGGLWYVVSPSGNAVTSLK
jgi:predicted lipoprotein with Yx(FWY)xxD motif